MYDESLIQTLYGMLNGTNAATTKRQFVGDFNTFVLNHIPYAQVRARDLQTGLITFDGPKIATSTGIEKPLLVWHFAGLPYPIVKAALVEYNYLRMWDGSGQNVHASILFGFQEARDQKLYTSPIARATAQAKTIKTHVNAAGANFIDQLTATVTSLTETIPSATVTGSASYADLDSFVNSELGAVYGPYQRKLTSLIQANGSAAQLKSALRDLGAELPQGRKPRNPGNSKAANASDQNGADTNAGSAADSAGGASVENVTHPQSPAVTQQVIALMLQGAHKSPPLGLKAVGSGPFTVEFDGPAREADSHHIFPYTFETLVNDREKFDQILWWYFAGKPVRITKAMRIPLASNDPNAPSLFVGYSGPGSFP